MVFLSPQLVQFNRGDGACVHLTEANDCAIYEQRPDACRISASFGQARLKGATREEFDKVTGLACLWLMQEMGAPWEKKSQMIQILTDV